MDIKVTQEQNHWGSIQTGGEYADCALNITVDKELPLEQQQLLVIHAVIENYFPSTLSRVHQKTSRLISFLRITSLNLLFFSMPCRSQRIVTVSKHHKHIKTI